MRTRPSHVLPGAEVATFGRPGYSTANLPFFLLSLAQAHRGELAKTPHSVELDVWYHLLWLQVCALTGSFVVIEISQVGCCLSLKVSQPEEHSQKLHQEERLVGEGVGAASP